MSEVDAKILAEDLAKEWAWQQVKNDCALHNLTVGEEVAHYGFFSWGWNYRQQYEKQKGEAK